MSSRTEMNIWRIQQDWAGETVVIIGGGPSVTMEQVEQVRQSGHKVIVINDSHKIAPWADVLYAGDIKWWNWHDGAPDFKGLKIGLRYCADTNGLEGKWTEDIHPDVKSLAYHRARLDPAKTDGSIINDGISVVPGVVISGKDSGYVAIQIAIQMGARKIILLGYDMKAEQVDLSRDEIVVILDQVLGSDYPVLKREAIASAMGDIMVPHWHGHHPDRIPPPFDLMLKQYPSMLTHLLGLDVEVINCTPGSYLHAFWKLPLEEAI